MTKQDETQSFPTGKAEVASAHELDDVNRFVALLPELCYSANRLLEDCTPEFSKKVGVALWALGASKKTDAEGKFLSNKDLVATFRNWFVVSKASASPEVAKVKKELFGRRFIRIEGGPGHIHLSKLGEDALRKMHARARIVVQRTVSVLTPEERRTCLDLTNRMIATIEAPSTVLADRKKAPSKAAPDYRKSPSNTPTDKKTKIGTA